MLQRSAEALCSHIFFGSWRRAAESSAGARPNDSIICRFSLVVIYTHVAYLRRASRVLASLSYSDKREKTVACSLIEKHSTRTVGKSAPSANSQIGKVEKKCAAIATL